MPRAIADDAAILLVGAGQKAGDILQRDDRHVIGIADANEVGRFDRGFDVDGAGQHHRLVGHDADDPAVEPGKADDHVFRPELMYLQKAAVVNNAGDDLAHIVRLVRVDRHQLFQFRTAPVRIIDGGT